MNKAFVEMCEGACVAIIAITVIAGPMWLALYLDKPKVLWLYLLVAAIPFGVVIAARAEKWKFWRGP